ncbi:uncharacterized protein [Leptinotarsa decemlineata]|uniref:uncharacterized protein n=1 Tax=Leptinotarsa decemlineata TaxID=7539 RepID=UPI003D30A335
MHLIIIFVIAVFQVVRSIPVGVTVGLDPQLHAIQTLYHSQDKYGQYAYGYATPTAMKSETQSSDGITRGGYSYIDSNGYLQTVEYIVDPVHGFRVAASNLPRDDPDVVFARAKHIAEYEAIKAERAQIAAGLTAVPYSNPVAVPINNVPQISSDHQIPQPVTDLPEVVRARNEHLAALRAAYANVPILPQPVQDLPEVVKARQEHLAAVAETERRNAALANQVNLSPVPQDTSGFVVPLKTVPSAGIFNSPDQSIDQNAQVSYTPALFGPAISQEASNVALRPYSYGYTGPLSGHSESRSADGVTRGGYSYIDANGIVQNVQYVADAENGFRVTASNIPIDVNHIQREAPAAPENPNNDKVIVKATPANLYSHEIVY